ncbi:carboxymuconolactone decarboxylase family protein [Streptomyces sp. NPDC005423]|uniref:carboxymuconolactone decarboxylase family protein n=1 Tax=Streptomyces sp. NPDC005423 TaxID=3155343 RepID=UPI0033AB9AD5
MTGKGSDDSQVTYDSQGTHDPAPGPDLRTAGLKALRDALPGVFPEGDIDLRDGLLGEDLVEIGLTSVWGGLWAREGLGARDRSLVTLGILIALGAETELRTHVRIALTNGLTEDEIAEVIYHAGGYAGFPRATAARTAARAALAD